MKHLIAASLIAAAASASANSHHRYDFDMLRTNCAFFSECAATEFGYFVLESETAPTTGTYDASFIQDMQFNVWPGETVGSYGTHLGGSNTSVTFVDGNVVSITFSLKLSGDPNDHDIQDTWFTVTGMEANVPMVGGYQLANFRTTLADTAAPVPEPSTWALLGLGLAALTARGRIGRGKDRSTREQTAHR